MSAGAVEDPCRNCGAPLGGARYCGACGQRRAQPLEVGRLLAEGAGQLASLDNAWWHTLRELTLRPGAMVRRYVAGERKRFVNPILYMVTMATVLLAALNLLEIDLGLVQAVEASQREGFQLMVRAVGYLAVVVALPLAWAIRLVLRQGLVGEYYVLLIYAYAQLTVFQVLLYALGAASDPAYFMGSRFASALFFGWVFADYFDRRRVLAALGGVVAYFAMLMLFIVAGGALVAAAGAAIELAG